jgi:hypothetical protein
MWAKPVTKPSGVRSVILFVISEANQASCEALTSVISEVTPGSVFRDDADLGSRNSPDRQSNGPP